MEGLEKKSTHQCLQMLHVMPATVWRSFCLLAGLRNSRHHTLLQKGHTPSIQLNDVRLNGV